MRKSILIMMMLLFLSTAAYAGERFMIFPALGVCTGTYVRYREEPDTESEILGRLNAPEKAVVLSQTAVDGEIWYEIENPLNDSEAWIFGKYIRPAFDETTQQSEIYNLIVNIIQNYGITPEKADLNRTSDVKTNYEANNLTYVEVWNKTLSFGDIHIGDSTGKIIEVLGTPDIQSDSEYEYRTGEKTRLNFHIKNGKITRMIMAL